MTRPKDRPGKAGDDPEAAAAAGSATRRAIEAVWRLEAAKVIAVVARITRDVCSAEEASQDALVAALEHWPRAGIPDNAGAWLTATAKRRALDRIRHDTMARGKHEAIGADLDAAQALFSPDVTEILMAAEADPIGDDLLRLLFTACHPVLSRDAQEALTLRLVCGLATAEIARAFLVPEATIAQRIVRAKRQLSEAQVPFELPPAGELEPRLSAVLEVVYLLFNEGYAATSGTEWMRPALCEEALRLARMLSAMAPSHPEVHGLAALLELQSSRLGARRGADGRPVLLPDQDRSRWDRRLISRGLESLDRAIALDGADGPYALQAAIAACHARAARAIDTDWPRICTLYAALARVMPSPVVELNRAVAIGMAEGPAAALPLVQAIAGHPRFERYHLLPSVLGDLLQRLGRGPEARLQFERAATLATNVVERELLLARAKACDG